MLLEAIDNVYGQVCWQLFAAEGFYNLVQLTLNKGLKLCCKC